MKISVIIVNYNDVQAITRCLLSLHRQDYASFEVIVVDNASSDNSADLIERDFDWVKIIRNSENKGFGQGNNIGASIATGSILAFLNPDTEADPDWLSALARSFNMYPEADLVTSKIVLMSDESVLNSAGNIIHYTGVSCCRGLGESSERYSEPEWDLSISGAAFAVRRAVFDDIGGFDPLLFLYHDDVDFSLRSKLAGYRSLYAPSCRVKHDFCLTLPARKWFWIEQNRLAVMIKIFSWHTLLLLLPAIVFVELLTCLYLLLQGYEYILAKLTSYIWLVQNYKDIQRSRAIAQQKRRVSDGQMLSLLSASLPFSQLLQGRAGRAADRLLNSVFRGMLQISTAVIR